MRKSQTIALISVFAAFNAILDSVPGLPQLSAGVWYGWIFIIEPLNGIILGPFAGFLSTLIGVMVGHSIFLRGEVPLYEYIYTLGAPLGAMISGLLYRNMRRLPVAYFIALVAAYFLTPIAWNLPVWGIWNTLLAFAILCIINFVPTKFSVRIWERFYGRVIIAFIGLEADILFRVFLLIPCQTYQTLYSLPVESLQLIWAAAAVITPIQVTMSIIVTAFIGQQLLRLRLSL